MLPAHFAVPVAVAAALATALAAPVSAPAAVEVPTCHGKPATIVGEPGELEVAGTAGDDVIVTTDTDVVVGGAGDDTICLRGAVAPEGGVVGGPGDDYVDATAAVSRRLVAILGGGEDVYLGSPGRDDVSGGDRGGPDTERDVIRTGAGKDAVASGSLEMPNDDVVVLGADADRLIWLGVSGGDGEFLGGPGKRDSLSVHSAEGSAVVVDARLDIALVDGEKALVRGEFEGSFFDQRQGTVSFLGSDRNERASSVWAPLTARMGGGNDWMLGGRSSDALYGGPGRDHADGRAKRDRCVAELEQKCER